MDFELSQALEGPSDSDEVEIKSTDKKDIQDELIRIDEGLNLLVTYNKVTMKKGAVVVLAATKWKTLLTKLSDAELCSVIMDNLVDETVVESVVTSGTKETNCSFSRMDSQTELTLCDNNQKAVIFKSGELQATTLKGGYDNLRVNFKLASYSPCSHADAQTVALSVKNTKLHISCSMQGDEAKLKLEEYSKESLKQITDENMKRFLFYKRSCGISHSVFESTNCPGWVISTANGEENQPVEMCRKTENTHRITNFRVI